MAINTLPVQFRRNYAEAPFVGMVFIDDPTAFNDWLTDPTRYAGQMSAFVDTVGDTVTIYKLSADKSTWEELGSSSGSGVTTADIDVLDVDQGSYESGDTIPAGTDIETIIANMLRVVIPPTYTAPTLSLSGSGTKSVEVGTSITPVLTPTFNQNDGGSATNYELDKDAVQIFTDTSEGAYTDGPFNIGEGSTVFEALIDYDDGPVKNDNTGTPDPTGQILAGTAVSNTVTYFGRRNAFYDIDGDTTTIRNNGNTFLNPSNGSSFSISGSGDTLVVSYPDTLRDLTLVQLVSSGFTFDITSEMTRLADQTVAGANGVSPITYKVFEYSPASSFTSADFNITI